MRLNSSLRRFVFWALLVFCLVSAGVSGKQTLWYFSHGPTVSDFRIFMTGVEMVRSGEGRDLYHFDAQKRAQSRLYPETAISGLLPFNHLAFELLYYWPVSWLSYRSAIVVWAIFNLGLIFVVGWLLAPYTQALRQATEMPVAILLIAFYPVIFAMGEGQDSLIFLFLLVLSLRAIDANRSSVAGFVLALACFKLHLALAIAFFVLFLRGKWRGLAGFAGGGVVVSGISLAMVGPHMFSDYLAMLHRQAEMTPWGFIPWYMPNLRGLLQWGLAPWLDVGTILPVIFAFSVIVAVVGGWIVLRAHDLENGFLYSIAILTTVLISYHFHMQDLSIAGLPILLLLDRLIAGQSRERDLVGLSPARGDLSTVWSVVLAAAVAGLYLFRVVAEPYPFLLIHGCLLCIPLLCLWLVSLRVCCAPQVAPCKLPALQTT